MNLDAIRADIPALERSIYVNTGWSGPSPRRVLRAISEYLEFEAAVGPTSPVGVERRVDADRRARSGYAALLGCDAGEVALTDNTTVGVNIIFAGLPWQEGDRLVTSSVEHPGIQVPALFATKRHRLDLQVVDCDASASTQSVIDGFDRAITAKTRLVAFSHISYANGMRLPLKEITAIAHARGALIVVDGAQTAGHIAIDVNDLGVDFYAVPGHKWLLGPDGTGALFLRRDRLAEVSPALVGYWATESYQMPDTMVENVKDARRYQVSTTNGGLWSGVAEALAIAAELGVARIEERSVQLASYAVGRLMSTPGVRVVSPREGPAVSGLVCFQVEGVPQDSVTGTLVERDGVTCRSVESTASTRLSLAYFNTEADIDRAVSGAARIAKEGPIDVAATEWWRVMHGPADEI